MSVWETPDEDTIVVLKHQVIISYVGNKLFVLTLTLYACRYATCNKKINKVFVKLCLYWTKFYPEGVSVLRYTIASYLRHSNASSKAKTWQLIEEDVPSILAA